MLYPLEKPSRDVCFANSEIDNRYRELTRKDSRYNNLWKDVFAAERILDKLPDQLQNYLLTAMDSLRALEYWYKEHEKEFGSSTNFQYDRGRTNRANQNMNDMQDLIRQLIKIREKNRMDR